MDTGVIRGKSLAWFEIPEESLGLLRLAEWSKLRLSWLLHFEDPHSAPISISSNAEIYVQSEAKQEVAEKHSMIFSASWSSCEERLHRLPNLYLLLTALVLMIGNEWDKLGSVKRRLQNTRGMHRVDELARRLLDMTFSIVRISIYLHEPILETWS